MNRPPMVGIAALLLVVAGCENPSAGPAPSPTATVTVTASPEQRPSATGTPANGVTSPSATSAPSTGTSTPVTRAVPAIKVAPYSEAAAPQSVQKYADDLAAGNATTIAQKCWTLTPSQIANQISKRREILSSLSSPGMGAQGGAVWGQGRLRVAFTWAEMESRYACPSLDGSLFEADAAALFIHRLAARLKGTPYRPTDTEQNYPLLCDGELSEGFARIGVGTSGDISGTPAEIRRAVMTMDGQPVRVQPMANGGYHVTSTTGQRLVVSTATSSACLVGLG